MHPILFLISLLLIFPLLKNYSIIFILRITSSKFLSSSLLNSFNFYSNLIYRNSITYTTRNSRRQHFFERCSGGQVSRNPIRPSVVYIHFYIFLPLHPFMGSSPVAALPFSPGVVRLPSHRVMTYRLSDLARGEAARFEPRNDRHRRSEEDEEKDRTEAADKRERDGDLEEVNTSETTRSKEANLLRTQYLGRHLRGKPDASDAASRNSCEDLAFRGRRRSIQLRAKDDPFYLAFCLSAWIALN